MSITGSFWGCSCNIVGDLRIGFVSHHFEKGGAGSGFIGGRRWRRYGIQESGREDRVKLGKRRC